jgi:hypothetical protein
MTVCAAAAVKIVKAIEGSRKLFKATRIRRRKKSSLISNLSELLDLEWMEQRLYDLEEGPDAPIGARNIGHIFREDSNTTGGEELAAILVIGEREDIIEIMDLLPLERVPRVTRVAELTLSSVTMVQRNATPQVQNPLHHMIAPFPMHNSETDTDFRPI